jgi:hypothetical protein
LHFVVYITFFSFFEVLPKKLFNIIRFFNMK